MIWLNPESLILTKASPLYRTFEMFCWNISSSISFWFLKSVLPIFTSNAKHLLIISFHSPREVPLESYCLKNVKKYWIWFLLKNNAASLQNWTFFYNFILLWIVYFVDTPGSRMENHLIGDTMTIESLNNLVEELWWLNLPETKMSVSIPFL